MRVVQLCYLVNVECDQTSTEFFVRAFVSECEVDYDTSML
jgi:hypothetical protein